MSATRIIRFRVTENQYLLIKNSAIAKGYTTMSAYLRELALEKGLYMEHLIIETHRIVKEIKEKIENK